MNESTKAIAGPQPPKITTFLTFSGELYGKAEEIINFYISAFPESRLEYFVRHGQGEQVPAGELQRAAFTLAGQRFMATEMEGDDRFAFTHAFSLYVEFHSPEELTATFAKLSNGGKVHMRLAPYPSSELFVWFDDKYGISWQLEIPKTARKPVVA